jgi:hypothetical protein
LNHTREIAKSVELLNRDLAWPVAIEGSERLLLMVIFICRAPCAAKRGKNLQESMGSLKWC